MMEERKNEMARNAKRLAHVMWERSEDPAVIKALASANLLNYYEEQLSKDMNDIYEYVNYLEKQLEER